MKTAAALLAFGLGVAATACASSGEGGREVVITQRDDGCTPTRIEATAGEKLKLVVKNESGDDYEVEGIEGTKLEEVVVPSGRTRTPGYNVPDSGTHKIKCYVPAGPSTIIEVVVSGASGSESATEPAAEATAAGPAGSADATVEVELSSYAIVPQRDSVAAGAIRFVATNAAADEVHELAILRREGDGFEVAGEIEDLAPGASGELVLDLQSGEYELACVIVPGEAGSTVDHYREGMHTAFQVE